MTLRRALLDWKIVIPLVLAVSVICAFGIYARPGAMVAALRDFDYVYLAPILGLAFLNYVVRLVRWGYFLRVADVSVGRERSAGDLLQRPRDVGHAG